MGRTYTRIEVNHVLHKFPSVHTRKWIRRPVGPFFPLSLSSQVHIVYWHAETWNSPYREIEGAVGGASKKKE